jgi:hypothetical protein
MDVPAQEAYLRGHATFLDAAEIAQRLGPTKRRNWRPEQEAEMMRCYQQAHTALTLALAGELALMQRLAGIEIMSVITRAMAARGMTSGLEATFWNRLIVQQTAQREHDELAAKLAQERPGDLWGPLHRLRWRLRQRQLRGALAQMKSKLAQLEQLIAFDTPPRRY